MNLVIVESPAKAKTIQGYLGENYEVRSSVGHILDLATSGPGGLGIDVENNFEPTYKVISGKKKVINELKKLAKKADKVYIATDLDREGEAIGAHLIKELELSPEEENRIVFSEITKTGIQNGINNPRKIDLDLVESQETRRMVDRIMGFKLSTLLKKKIKAQSAGRVQSVALKMIVNREREIESFTAKDYYKLLVNYQDYTFEYEKNDKLLPLQEVESIVKDIEDEDFVISDIITKSKKVQPPRPFVTSTFQQACINKLGFTSKKAMRIAQQLYEGIEINHELTGLITYMRTDSQRLSNDFQKTISDKIEQLYGKEYVGKVIAKKNKNSQDAHEAIRPTKVELLPDEIKNQLTKDQYQVYKLIYENTLKSMMTPATLETKTYIGLVNGYKFKLPISNYTFLGYKQIEGAEVSIDPKLEKSTKLDPISISVTEHQTNPPARYSEATLVKSLEENGVGRPSTYASIIDILKTRGYVEIDKRRFKPTADGFLVTDKLQEYFSDIIDEGYTATLEEELDEIAHGNADKLVILTKFYDKFIADLTMANENMPAFEAKKTGEVCPECGSDLVERKGKHGVFVACSGFPKCRYIKPSEQESVGKCPKCQSDIIKKHTKRGKIFYGCKSYPKCDYAVWKLEDLPS